MSAHELKQDYETDSPAFRLGHRLLTRLLASHGLDVQRHAETVKALLPRRLGYATEQAMLEAIGAGLLPAFVVLGHIRLAMNLKPVD